MLRVIHLFMIDESSSVIFIKGSALLVDDSRETLIQQFRAGFTDAVLHWDDTDSAHVIPVDTEGISVSYLPCK